MNVPLEEGRITDDFRHSVIVLREARNVKYGTFMEPGRQMRITAELVERDGPLATFKGKGEVDGASTVSKGMLSSLPP